MKTQSKPETKQEHKTMNPPESAKHDGSSSALPAEPTIPSGIDRRSFIMRKAAIGAAALTTGKAWTPEARAAEAAKEAGGAKLGASPLSPNLNVVKKSKGPVMTVLDEFCKVGPGPSSSHTIGPLARGISRDAAGLARGVIAGSDSAITG